jgi:hypothetical protein
LPRLIGRRPAMLLSLVVLSSSAVGCGGTDGGARSVAQDSPPPPAPASATAAAPAPTATATTPAATVPAPAPQPSSTEPTATTGQPAGEQQPGGAGDEQAARVPAEFTVRSGAIAPARITVPAFLTIDLAVTARDAGAHVTLDAPGGGTYDVAPGATSRHRIEGLRPGDYRLTAEGGAAATLHVVAGGAPGP